MTDKTFFVILAGFYYFTLKLAFKLFPDNRKKIRIDKKMKTKFKTGFLYTSNSSAKKPMKKHNRCKTIYKNSAGYLFIKTRKQHNKEFWQPVRCVTKDIYILDQTREFEIVKH